MHVDVRGVSLHVQELGDRAEAPDVVMLHGLLLGSVASWYFTAAPALAARRRVVLFDLRGHGLSARTPDGYDVASMARDLAGVVAARARTPVDLVGHSFGALVALRFALDAPQLVRRLVLVEAPLPPSSLRELDAFVGSSPEQMLTALPPSLQELVRGGGRRATRLVETLRGLCAETTLVADLLREPDLADAELAKLDLPALCVAGDQSSCRSSSERLARALPNAALRVLAGGHYLHLDATARLTEQIGAFLDG